MPRLPPDDLFSTVISPTLDDTRAIVQDLGLRAFRVILVMDEWEGPGKREGYLQRRQLTEILPSPRIRPFAVTEMAKSSGLQGEGDLFLSKISRQFSGEQLMGKTIYSQDIDEKFDFSYAVLPIQGDIAEMYSPSSRPELRPTEWRLRIRPINRRTQLVI